MLLHWRSALRKFLIIIRSKKIFVLFDEQFFCKVFTLLFFFFLFVPEVVFEEQMNSVNALLHIHTISQKQPNKEKQHAYVLEKSSVEATTMSTHVSHPSTRATSNKIIISPLVCKMRNIINNKIKKKSHCWTKKNRSF